MQRPIPMQIHSKLSTNESIPPLRTRYRDESNGQFVHDSIHRREGWTRSYRLDVKGVAVGFGSVAISWPWKDKPTVFEFYVLPEHRARAFDLKWNQANTLSLSKSFGLSTTVASQTPYRSNDE